MQRRALGVCALVSTIALIWLSLPVGSGLVLGTLLAFSLLRVRRAEQGHARITVCQPCRCKIEMSGSLPSTDVRFVVGAQEAKPTRALEISEQWPQAITGHRAE
jgi:hypothetical protein